MGQYLHLYGSESAFNVEYNGEDYHEPWVSYTYENGETPHVDYNKRQGIASIPVYHGTQYAGIDIPVNSEDGFSFSYTGSELRQWLDPNGWCQFRIAEEFVDSIEISAPGWDGDYRYDLYNGFYNLVTRGSGWENTRVTINLNPSSNLEDAKVFDMYYDQ